MESGDPPAIFGGTTFTMESRTLPGEKETRRLHSLAETRGLEVFAPVELERVEGRKGLLVFTGSGPDHDSLWVQGERHHVDALGRDHVRVVFEGNPLTPRFLVAATQQSLPATLAEWEAKQARKREAIERSRREADAQRERSRATAEPVTYDDIVHDGARLTLRQAGEVVRKAAGTIEVRNARLVVSLPPHGCWTLGQPSIAAKAATRLYLAETAVVAKAPKGGGDITVEKLPDKFVLPTGALAP